MVEYSIFTYIHFCNIGGHMDFLKKTHVTNRQIPSDHRKHERKVYGATVDLTVDRITYMVELLDLSLGGVFLSADNLPPIEPQIKVSLSIPYEKKPWSVQLPGTVRRLSEKGLGIEFF